MGFRQGKEAIDQGKFFRYFRIIKRYYFFHFIYKAHNIPPKKEDIIIMSLRFTYFYNILHAKNGPFKEPFFLIHCEAD